MHGPHTRLVGKKTGFDILRTLKVHLHLSLVTIVCHIAMPLSTVHFRGIQRLEGASSFVTLG